LHERALTIREKVQGPDHPEVAESTSGLAVLHKTVGQYAEATPLFERAIAIFEESLGVGHPHVAATINNLALLHVATGDYEAAVPLFERALAIWEKGADRPRVGSALNNLGLAFMKMGDFTRARPLFTRALAVQEMATSTDPFDRAAPLHNLAGISLRIGDYAEARDYYERSLAVLENASDTEHVQTAHLLNDYGVLLWRMGDYTGAQELYKRSLAIKERALGANHPDTATTLHNLGPVLAREGDYAGARAAYERALAIKETALGQEHPSVASTLTGLAELTSWSGDYVRARVLFERAVAILEKSLGEHPELARSLDRFAESLALSGNAREASEAALRAERIRHDHLRLTARGLPERQALAYASREKPSGLDLALTVALLDPESELKRMAWDRVIRSRAVILDEMATRVRSSSRADAPDVARLATEVAAAREQLARLVVRGLGDDPPERYRSLIDGARRRKEEGERALAQRSLSFRQEVERSQVALNEVGEALIPNSALIALVRFNRYGLESERPEGLPAPPVPSYLAFVLREANRELAVVPLGTSSEIDSLVSRLRRQIAQEAMGTGPSLRKAEASYRQLALELHRKVWTPVSPYLRDIERVFIVPDGSLNLVNLAALPTGSGHYLVESGPLLHYLSAERDLVLLTKEERLGQGMLAMGDPEGTSAGE
jgi:tetratricopeptide (TPR) repeat protein